MDGMESKVSRPTVSELDRLATVGWKERQHRLLQSYGERELISDSRSRAVWQLVYGGPYKMSDGMSVAPVSGERIGERRRVVSMELARVSFGSYWLDCRDVLHLRQQGETHARVTDIYQFLWDEEQVKHAHHHVEVADKFGATGEMAPLDCVFDTLAAPNDVSALEAFDLEGDFGAMTQGECVQLADMLESYYAKLRTQSRA